MMGLKNRFEELGAPEGFAPELGIPLSWSTTYQDVATHVYFDPVCATGFPLRVMLPHGDIAFDLLGRKARENTLVDE